MTVSAGWSWMGHRAPALASRQTGRGFAAERAAVCHLPMRRYCPSGHLWAWQRSRVNERVSDDLVAVEMDTYAFYNLAMVRLKFGRRVANVNMHDLANAIELFAQTSRTSPPISSAIYGAYQAQDRLATVAGFDQ
ncbi:hypothetical protein CVT26_003369 [Gymnopilus dilepis]|uniref:Uncharacterized protein n=1 Tax=Gymnopilus dilepis TaxID=231916 RepID=A0A409VQL2_9AGAR|nr:hypothetical protein CVT26_003369 [Gymnopilus dilepis]